MNKKYKVFPELQLNNISIKNFQERHITQRYVDWFNDPDVVRYSEHRHSHHTLETERNYFKKQKNSENTILAIELNNDKPLHIGNLRVFQNQFNNLASLSILIGDKEYWGKGIATKVWCSCLDKLLTELEFRIVIAGTMEVNKPMVKLIKRSGMTIDAILPARFVWNNNETGLLWASKKKA